MTESSAETARLVAAATPAELDAVPRDWTVADEAVAGAALRVADDAYGLVTGVGPADAAMRVAAALERLAVDGVLSVGLAGALPGSGLAVGDAAVGTRAVQADLGREEPDGFVELDAMGLDEDAVAPGPFQLAGVGATGARGPIASVSTVSATDERARSIAERTGAVVETMETAAVARVGATYGVPVAAVAGVSNRAATDRGFDADAGLEALASALADGALEVTP